MAGYSELLNAAQDLESSEKLRLIDALWESISPDEWPGPDEAWVAEAQRRSTEFDRGETAPSDWTAVRARARQKAGLGD